MGSREEGTRGRWLDTYTPRPSPHVSHRRCGFPHTEGKHQGLVHPTVTMWTATPCPCREVSLYFDPDLRYRDSEGRRAACDAHMSPALANTSLDARAACTQPCSGDIRSTTNDGLTGGEDRGP